ncbi:hypothetical protein J4418_00880 [Candidatus Woesearchaeota archaeon]|nr:hypothetical protein [Candidatus Woesearchaeota archaeon]
MAKKSRASNKPGRYSFLAGILIAVIAGLFSDIIRVETATFILAVLGLVVGFLNVTAKEVTEFLVAAIALLLAGVANVTVSLIPVIGSYLQAILVNITTFSAFAALIVAIKSVVMLAEE